MGGGKGAGSVMYIQKTEGELKGGTREIYPSEKVPEE